MSATTYVAHEHEPARSSEIEANQSYFITGLKDFYGSDAYELDMRSMARLIVVMLFAGGLAMYHTASLHFHLSLGALRDPHHMTEPYAIFMTFLSGVLSMWLTCCVTCVANGVFLLEYRYKRQGRRMVVSKKAS